MGKKKCKLKKVLLSVLVAVIVIAGAIAIANVITSNSLVEYASSFENVAKENALQPDKDESGSWVFTSDEEFKVMQLTDIHIGGGFLSASKDKSALLSVATMIKEAQPDLVIVTGDIAFPVPYAAGTFNNKSGAKIFSTLMESLGVYWTVVFGNHDTESYSYFDREAMSEFYSAPDYKYCLYSAGPEEVDGYGNYVIKVKNTDGIVTQGLICMDSHSYTDGDWLGMMWKYDNLHENQIEWYKEQIEAMNSENKALGSEETVKSMVFIHIPLTEYKSALTEFAEAGYKDTDNVQYHYGMAGETGKVVYHGMHEDNFFETALELDSTKAIFCGHDHYNNFSLEYKGIRLTYGYSIDFLAYIGINKEGSQRGFTMISLLPDGTYECEGINYYSSDVASEDEKASVTMQFEDVTYQRIEE